MTSNAPMDKVKTNNKTIYISIAILVLFAIVSITVRTWFSNTDDLPSGDTAWTIAITQQIKALDKGATVSISPPWDTRYARMYAQSLSHSGLRQKRTRADSSKRDIVFVAPKAGSYTTETIFSIHVSSLQRSEPKKLNLSEENRSQWLSSESHEIQVETPKTTEIVERLSASTSSSDQLITKLFDFISSNVRIKKSTNKNSETVLSKKVGTALGANHALVALLRSAHLPARIVTGVNLQATAAQQPYYWTEVYNDERWIPLDPVHGHINILPADYIPMRRGGSELVETTNATVISTAWRIGTTQAPSALLSAESRSFTDILDLNRLSPANRENLGVLLLLPLGVLVTEILRQLLGVRTYGTFTPTLLALAIIHVDQVTALIIFSFVTVIGISIRPLLSALNLKRTPLLSIVFTLVALSMTFVVSSFMYFDPRMDGILVLLPVVILTMLVDRIYSIADQRGIRTAMTRLFWTVVSASLSLMVLLQAEWSHWLVSYPELHAVTLAAIIFVGHCSCVKLSGVRGLSWIYEPDLRKNRSTDKAEKKVSQSGLSGDSL